MGMKFETMEDEEESESEEEEETEYSKTRTRTSFSSNSKTNLSVNYDASNNKVSQLSLNHRLLMQRKEELVKYDHARSYSRRSDDEKNDALKMFEWQSNTHSNVRPRFRSMKEEILNNPYYKLTICEYEELELKTEIIC